RQRLVDRGRIFAATVLGIGQQRLTLGTVDQRFQLGQRFVIGGDIDAQPFIRGGEFLVVADRDDLEHPAYAAAYIVQRLTGQFRFDPLNLDQPVGAVV